MNNRSRLPALNALKHGVFSNVGVLPGENGAEFQVLHQELKVEFKPSGPFEEDLVLDLAKCLWRKSRLGIYQRAAWAAKAWQPYLIDKNEPDFDLDYALTRRGIDQMQKLLGNLNAIQARAEADSKVMPAIQEFNTQAEKLVKADGIDPEEILREGIIDLQLGMLSDLVTRDSLKNELELLGRLDSRIDRLMKKLMQLKAMKSMVGLGSATQVQQVLPPTNRQGGDSVSPEVGETTADAQANGS